MKVITYLQITILIKIIFFSSFAVAQYNQEAILNYRSEINVLENAELIITETIQVNAQGQKIRRGIYRDFPTSYRDHLGHKYKVGFEVLSVKREGSDEAFHLQNLSNGVRVYIGQEKVFLNSGEHTYTLTYRTNRQLGFFPDHDELYFNAIGQGWDFPIRSAEVRVNLPQGVPHNSIKFDGFSGPFGANSKDFKASLMRLDNTVIFKLSRPLSAYEGLSVVVTWPKGVITEPSTIQKWKYFISDNSDVLIGMLGLLLTFVYYYIAWYTSGRDPDKGPIFPQWEIPENLSPGEVRYLNKMAFDKKILAVTLLGMAVKGSIKIINQSKNEYRLEKMEGPSDLTSVEQLVCQSLFRGSTSFDLDNSNHSEMTSAIDVLERSYKSKHLKRTFYSNAELILPGIFMMFLTGFLELYSQKFNGGSLANVGNVLILIAFIVMHIVFKYLLKAPTFSGRKVMDKIDGLKMYLGTAERDRLNRINVPQDTPQVFEKFLPYAVALGVQNTWSDRFASVFSGLAEQGQPYHPIWYNGVYNDFNNFNVSSFGSDFSKSFGDSIVAASSPPGSSSGSDGGGSSGGGGGGGGGGGW